MATLDECIQASADFISSVPAGPKRSDAYNLVFQRLMRLIGSCKLTLQQAAAANNQFAEMQFPQELLDQLLNKVMVAASSEPAQVDNTARRQLQDWTSLASYMTDSQWEKLADSTVAETEKLECVLLHAMALGLQLPTESTFQFLTGFHLLMHVGSAGLSAMQPSVRHELLKAIKMHFKRLFSRCGHQGPYVQCLPANPNDFAAQFSYWHGLAFNGAAPAAPRLQSAEIARAMLSIPMRSTNCQTRPQQQQTWALQQSHGQPAPQMLNLGSMDANAQSGTAQFGQVANFMFQQMQQMQQNQMAMMQMLKQQSQTSSPLQLRDDQHVPPVSTLPFPSAPLARAPSLLRLETQLALQSTPVTPQRPATALLTPPKPATKVAEVPEAGGEAGTSADEPPAQVVDKRPLPRKSAEEATAAVQAALAARSHSKGKAQGPKPKSKAKEPQPKKKVQKPASKSEAKKPVSKNPSVNVERSRNQILGRTGLIGPGQTKTFSFNVYGSEEKAMKEAKKWLQNEKKQRGIV